MRRHLGKNPDGDRDPLPEPWTQRDIDALHEMVQEFHNMKWFRRKLKWYGFGVLGIPAAILAFWEPVEKLLKLYKAH